VSTSILRTVPWLNSLGEEALAEVITSGEIVQFRPGKALVRELEVGDSLFILLAGKARATVAAGPAGPVELGTLTAGQACGELALLTRELRSATVTAVDEVTALRIDRPEFDTLLARHPRIAVHFAREIGARLADSDRALDALLTTAQGPQSAEAQRLSGVTAAVIPQRGSILRAFREGVLSKRHDLPFLALGAFLATLVAARLAIGGLEKLGVDLFSVLRVAYTSGFAMLIFAVSASFVRFSPRTRKTVAIVFGVGFALVFNELSVFLAFDTFYLDMTTRDAAMSFDVATLYHRSESLWAIALTIAALAQATYLRRFYRRVGFILATRLRALASRR
jgi:CRP-like cAMP-binding protein